MKTLESAKRCKKITDALLRINQGAFIRDENLNPIGVNWDLEKQSDVFTGLVTLRDELILVIESLSKL